MKASLGANAILLPTPAMVVGTYDSDGQPNVMTAAWGGICCSVPPCVAISLRKATYTYENIMEKGAFTIGIASEMYVREVDYFGTVSGRDTNKFEVTGLTAVPSEVVNAPYVGEFPMVLECLVLHSFEIGLHTQFIGEILDVKIDADVQDERGNPDPAKIKPCMYAPGSTAYYGLGRNLGKGFIIGRQAYGRH